MEVERPPQSFPLRYKLMLGFILCAPIAGFTFSFVIPYTIHKKKENRAMEAARIVDALAVGIERAYAESCALPPALPRLADISYCCGLEECVPDPAALATWEQAGVSAPTAPSTFTYETALAEDGSYRVRAIADFRCDPSFNHTYEVRLEPTHAGNACALKVHPGTTANEFY